MVLLWVDREIPYSSRQDQVFTWLTQESHLHHGINEGHPVILPQEMAFHTCNTNQKAQNFFESGFIMQKSVTHLLVLEILYHLRTFKYWVIVICNANSL